MVDLFEQIEEVVEFAEAANIPIPGGKVVNIAYLLVFRTGGMENPVNSGKTCRLDWKPGMLSKTILHKPTGATRSARKQQQWPMGMGSQRIIHRRQNPRSTLRMRYKHSHVQQWKTRRQWGTSPTSTSHDRRAYLEHKRKFWCFPSNCRHYESIPKKIHHPQREPRYIKKPRMLNRSATAGLMGETEYWTIPA